MPEREILVLPDLSAAAQAAVERVATIAEAAIRERGRFSLALAGGSTPAALYRLLASQPWRTRVDWSRTLVFFGDERRVPPDHPDSNYRMARETLLDHVSIPEEHIRRMAGELAAAAAVAQYEQELRTLSEPPGDAGLPVFDLILLGMGDDGHTASLFPGQPALDEAARTVVVTPVPAYVRPAVSRLTLTLPVLNTARCVLFLVAGASKAQAVRAVLRTQGGPSPLPAARVCPAWRLIWLLDGAAWG